MGHSEIDHRLARLDGVFIVLAESAIPVQPTEGPFHNPAVRMDLEPRLSLLSFDDLQSPSTDGFGPFDELTRIAAIGPDQRQARKPKTNERKEGLTALPILDCGGMDDHGEDQTERINEEMAFTSLDALARIVTDRTGLPPFCVVFTL